MKPTRKRKTLDQRSRDYADREWTSEVLNEVARRTYVAAYRTAQRDMARRRGKRGSR